METEARGVEPSPNEVVIEAWNTVLFEKFSRFKEILTQGLSIHSERFLGGRPYGEGARVLDVGCGFGDTTGTIAQAVGPSGMCVGIDCAESFIQFARREVRPESGRVEFAVVDVQHGDLGGPYDAAFARFGTMFFNAPVPAFRNIRSALRPGAELSQIVWRRREDNPWLHDAERCVRELVPIVDHEDTDAVHCGPGPFSLAGPDMVSAMLLGAGFVEIRFERFDAPICIGRTLGEAVSFALALGPAGEILRLAGDDGEERRPEVTAALQETLRTHLRDDGSVWAPSSAWVIRSTNPG